MQRLVNIKNHFIDLDLINNDSIVFDIGAYIGDTIGEIRKFIPNVIIYALEPSKDIYTELQHNIILETTKGARVKQYYDASTNTVFDENVPVLHGDIYFRNTFLENLALVPNSYPDKVEFNDYISNPGRGSINKIWDNVKETYKVNTLKINNLLNYFNVPHIDFLKIEVGGLEEEILNSMSQEVADKIKSMSIKLHQQCTTPDKIEAILIKLGYKTERFFNGYEMYCHRNGEYTQCWLKE